MPKKDVYILLTCPAGFKQEGDNEITAMLRGPATERDVVPALCDFWNAWWRVVNKDNDIFHAGRLDWRAKDSTTLEDLPSNVLVVKGNKAETFADFAEQVGDLFKLPVWYKDGPEGKEEEA
jgi:hypothetical protein